MLKDIKVFRVLLVHRVLKDIKVYKVLQDLVVLQVLKVLKDIKVIMMSNQRTKLRTQVKLTVLAVHLEIKFRFQLVQDQIQEFLFLMALRLRNLVMDMVRQESQEIIYLLQMVLQHIH